ncbi:MAG: hypothetical protein WBH14_09530, partial [Albidovulum sp.]
MEKLEAALAKAREMRKAALGAPEAIREKVNIPSNAEPIMVWKNLPEISVKPDKARNSRITTLLGGKDAAP